MIRHNDPLSIFYALKIREGHIEIRTKGITFWFCLTRGLDVFCNILLPGKIDAAQEKKTQNLKQVVIVDLIWR